jgi:hypothetical protein
MFRSLPGAGSAAWILIGWTSNAPGYYPSYGWNPGGALSAPGYATGYQGGAPPAPGYAAGYQAGAADAAACMEPFRSYDPVSRTYIGRDRQRRPCP